MARIFPGEHASQLPGRQPGEADRLLELQCKVENLEHALASQRMIGTVIGLLAQRYGCTTGEAWDCLRRLSQVTNVKVRDIARVILDSFDGITREEDAPVRAALDQRLPGGLWARQR